MADNINIPREDFDGLIEIVIDCVKKLKENIERTENLEKPVEITISENQTIMNFVMKILGILQKSDYYITTPAIHPIDRQKSPQDGSEVVQESGRKNEVARKVVHTVPGLNYFGDDMKRFVGKVKLKFYGKVFEAMQRLIERENIGDDTRVVVGEMF